MLVVVFILLGVFPCLLLAPIWIIAFFVSFNAVISEPYELQNIVVFLFAPSGLFGLIFFLITIADYANKESWSKLNYVTGLYGLLGALIAIYMDKYQLEYFSNEPTIISVVCPYPIIALVIAYLTRHKKQLIHDKNN